MAEEGVAEMLEDGEVATSVEDDPTGVAPSSTDVDSVPVFLREKADGEAVEEKDAEEVFVFDIDEQRANENGAGSDGNEDDMSFDQLLQAQIARGKTKYSFQKGDVGDWQVGFNVDTPEEAKKRQERAQRFGETAIRVKQEQRKERFGLVQPSVGVGAQTMRVDATVNSEVRNDAIHLYGTDRMSTRDIMKVFSDYVPSHIEWINDSSCNVVWGNATSAKSALWALGQPVEIDVADSDVPDYFRWRSIVSQASPAPLLIRAAAKSDLKKKNAAQESNYYKKLFATKNVPLPFNLHDKDSQRLWMQHAQANGIPIPKKKSKPLTSKSKRLRDAKGGNESAPSKFPARAQSMKKKSSAGGISNKLQSRLGKRLAPALQVVETGERYKPDNNPLKEERTLAMDIPTQSIAPTDSFGPDPTVSYTAGQEDWYSDNEEVMEDDDDDDAQDRQGTLHMDQGYNMPSW